jgi:hypothetical protein
MVTIPLDERLYKDYLVGKRMRIECNRPLGDGDKRFFDVYYELLIKVVSVDRVIKKIVFSGNDFRRLMIGVGSNRWETFQGYHSLAICTMSGNVDHGVVLIRDDAYQLKLNTKQNGVKKIIFT